MKAFMSKPGEQRARQFHEDVHVVCGAAVAEARRILAETEPDGPQTASFGIERIAARNCAPNVWTGALADALAAFVGEGR